MGAAEAKAAILANKTALGIEFGSTRIKAVLVDDKNQPIASGGHEWENRYENGVWTYSLEDIWTGIQDCYQDMAKDVKAKYDVELESVGALGISAMMHGYMPFNKKGELLVPFRTWRNNITAEASEKLMELFNYNIPQRWSIAHLYQAILNGEEHVKDIDYIATLEAYVHWKLTGKRVLGIGDAAGMFPIDTTKADYNQEMVDKFDELVAPYGFSWKFRDIMPKALVAGEDAGVLTEEGAKLLDVTGKLKAGIPMCPPEGDAGTGMVATNSVAVRTGNVSAGTSVFAMIFRCPFTCMGSLFYLLPVFFCFFILSVAGYIETSAIEHQPCRSQDHPHCKCFQPFHFFFVPLVVFLYTAIPPVIMRIPRIPIMLMILNGLTSPVLDIPATDPPP